MRFTRSQKTLLGFLTLWPLIYVLVFMLILINNRDIMGKYTNSKGFNGVAWVTTVIMVSLTLLLVVTSIFPHLIG